jgi:hypothetical protein
MNKYTMIYPMNIDENRKDDIREYIQKKDDDPKGGISVPVNVGVK